MARDFLQFQFLINRFGRFYLRLFAGDRSARAIMVVLWVVNVFSSTLPAAQQVATLVSTTLFGLGLAIYFAIRANTLAGQRYLENGWEFAEPNSAETLVAKRKWGITFDHSVERSDLTPVH